MVPLSFCILSMVPLRFFDYEWYPCVFERITTVTFSNFFRPKSSKTVNFFLFLLFFNLKHQKNKRKRKKLMILANVERK